MVNEKVLVTGASGYIASHVLDILLKRGYAVRGTVRSQKKADFIINKYPQYKDKLDFVIVEDIANEGAFEGALDGISGIFHLASPFHFKINDNKKDMLDPAIKGTTGILETALKFPSVKRVIITSSFAAILNTTKFGTGYVFTEKDWNPVTEEEAINGPARLAYRSSKKLAEAAAWKFVETKKPHFDIATICPPMVFGPWIHDVGSVSELNESVAQFYAFVNGKKVEPPAICIYVDVRDVALAHVLAFETPAASNQRYFVTAGRYDWQEVVDVAHKYFPGQTKADVGQPGVHPPPTIASDASKVTSQLGLVFRPKEECFRDSIAQLVELEKQSSK